MAAFLAVTVVTRKQISYQVLAAAPPEVNRTGIFGGSNF
jgi:hypothetical protein